ncbi:MAG TPA: SET domain-containing protein [bacterium]|nr:SET domain-containing protein [bacterium]HPN32590.1 SET domain-containing protein [bacterium]
MFLFKVYVANSLVHGKGLYAGEFIPKDSKIWEYDNKTVEIYDEREWNNLLDKSAKERKKELLKFAYKENNYWILHNDIMIYTNHSDNPNVSTNYKEMLEKGWNIKDAYTFAVKDIEKGEELTENYKEYFDEEIWNLHSML